MGYSNLYYTSLNLKKVMIFTYFNVTIYIEFELLVYLVNINIAKGYNLQNPIICFKFLHYNHIY
jgi:hypothetical protein